MKNKYIIQLDGLRFFAVLAVMIAHWLQWHWEPESVLSKIRFVHGVTLFFVLSGFLITRILLINRDKYNQQNENKFKLIKAFYIRRFLRIFPIYYLLIIALFIINFENTKELFLWLISYTINIYQSIHNTSVGFYSHFWSLAVEEQFYLFWPFIILFIKPKRTWIAIVGIIVLSLICRAYLYFYVGHWMATSYFTLSCMHALGLGALLAYFTIYKKEFSKTLSNPVILYVVIGLYVLLFYIQDTYKINWYKEIFDDFVFAIVSVFIILRASTNGFKFLGKVILENKFISYSGKISYGLYIYHLFISKVFYPLASKIGLSITDKYTLFVAFYLLTFLLAHISWKLIENPINSLKKKFPYS